jgi:hypothetical protein
VHARSLGWAEVARRLDDSFGPGWSPLDLELD